MNISAFILANAVDFPSGFFQRVASSYFFKLACQCRYDAHFSNSRSVLRLYAKATQLRSQGFFHLAEGGVGGNPTRLVQAVAQLLSLYGGCEERKSGTAGGCEERKSGLLVAAKSTRREWHCTVAASAREVGDEMRESLRGPASGIEAKS